jgi:hypothetical protein
MRRPPQSTASDVSVQASAGVPLISAAKPSRRVRSAAAANSTARAATTEPVEPNAPVS